MEIPKIHQNYGGKLKTHRFVGQSMTMTPVPLTY